MRNKDTKIQNDLNKTLDTIELLWEEVLTNLKQNSNSYPVIDRVLFGIQRTRFDDLRIQIKSNFSVNLVDDFLQNSIPYLLEAYKEALKKLLENSDLGIQKIFEEILEGIARIHQQIIVEINYTVELQRRLAEEQIQNLKNKYEEDIAEKIKDLDAAKRAYDGEKTEEIYTQASARYSKSAKNYEHAFYYACATSVVSTIVLVVLVHKHPDWLYEVIGVKVILALVLITLITLFLRRLSHYRKLADEADQKSLELSALPSFLREVKEEDQKEIYRELAGKYFGGGVDHSQNDKIGDLIDDQIKNLIELSKATVETAKGLKEVAEPSSKKSGQEETKPNNNDK